MAAASSQSKRESESRCLQLRTQWNVHQRRVYHDSLRRRGVLALALISEPLQRQWTEVFLDSCLQAWLSLVRTKHLANDLLVELKEECSSFQLSCIKQGRRRRAISALALISEPSQREWEEIHLDLAWSSWAELVDIRRQAQVAGEVERLLRHDIVQGCGPQESLRTTFSSCGVTSLFLWQWRRILAQSFPSLTPREIEITVKSLPCDKEGKILIDRLVEWLFDASCSGI
eukprot:TRINITY_DN35361_c0_g1_i1.p1 TRINITY_DN35361_c0_g1~~TRINITY_DN35361_c0_g1_i1.p1  ORF type:complete len:230 (-),score=24.02 TRINITY_DN35361_c0_g1_i1:120-809(-)